MGNVAQKRALKTYRARSGQRGFVRFEVMALHSDRELIRGLAQRPAEDGPEAARVRVVVQQAVSGGQPKSGGILAALRRSPMGCADVDLARSHEEGRKIEL